MLSTSTSFLSDRVFWLAMLAGPVCWWANEHFGLSEPLAPVNWQLLVMLCLVYPVLEELTFRGALQGALLRMPFAQKTALGLTVANGLSSLAFALFHLFNHNLFWSAAVIVPSLVFGFFRDRHQSVLPAIVLHCFYNLGFYLLR